MKAKNAGNEKIAENAKNARNAKIPEITEIAATEKVKILKTLKVWSLFGKLVGFFEQKLNFLQFLKKWQKHCRLVLVIFPKKNFSAQLLRFFWQKSGKTLNVGKFREYDEEAVILRKKFPFFGRFFFVLQN